MNRERDFLIQFSGLKLGKHQFEYQIDKTFFSLFEFEEYEDVAVQVEVELEKKTTMLELQIRHQGMVRVPCDLTGEVFGLPIRGQLDLVVKFGDKFDDENEELLILPHGEFQLSVAQYIYESIVLSVPAKRIHPGVEDGTLKSEALDYLDYREEEVEEEEDKETDPRWDILKQLLTDKK